MLGGKGVSAMANRAKMGFTVEQYSTGCSDAWEYFAESTSVLLPGRRSLQVSVPVAPLSTFEFGDFIKLIVIGLT